MSETEPRAALLADEIEAEGIERAMYGKSHSERIKINRLLADGLRALAAPVVVREPVASRALTGVLALVDALYLALEDSEEIEGGKYVIDAAYAVYDEHQGYDPETVFRAMYHAAYWTPSVALKGVADAQGAGE